MEPDSFEPGNIIMLEYNTTMIDASMEPDSFEPGNSRSDYYLHGRN